MLLSNLQAAPAWPNEPGSGRGRSHGTSSRKPFDRWFRYPAGFASDYVELLLDRLELTEGTVIDCFAGSGVTGTAARARGLSFVGIEAHPFVAELARLKLTPTATAAQIRTLAREVATLARRSEPSAPVPVDSEPDLIRRSFADDTLKTLLVLRLLIRERLQDPAALYLKWALLATLRDVADVKVGWPYQRPGIARKPRHSDPIARFDARVQAMANDIESVTECQHLISSQFPGQVTGHLASHCRRLARPERVGAASYASCRMHRLAPVLEQLRLRRRDSSRAVLLGRGIDVERHVSRGSQRHAHRHDPAIIG